MTKNPIINALAGLLYISLVAVLMFYGIADKFDNTILIPIAILSLFVLSAAAMAYIFLFTPLQLFLEGQKKESVQLFLHTLVVFALAAALFVSAGLYFTMYF